MYRCWISVNRSRAVNQQQNNRHFDPNADGLASNTTAWPGTTYMFQESDSSIHANAPFSSPSRPTTPANTTVQRALLICLVLLV